MTEGIGESLALIFICLIFIYLNIKCETDQKAYNN